LTVKYYTVVTSTALPYSNAYGSETLKIIIKLIGTR
jgi:hypothetical protein